MFYRGGYSSAIEQIKIHRLKGPASKLIDGTKYWYQNDMLHRLDGPAIESIDGTKAWYQDGKLHRLDGPAREFKSGKKRMVEK